MFSSRKNKNNLFNKYYIIFKRQVYYSFNLQIIKLYSFNILKNKLVRQNSLKYECKIK